MTDLLVRYRAQFKTTIAEQFQYRGSLVIIRQGTLSPLLVRPVRPIHRHIANNLTFKLLTLAVSAPVVVILALVFRPHFTITPVTTLAFVPALILAMALRFAVEWTVADSAFWVPRVSAINQLYYVAFLFLTGYAMPLPLLPGPIQTLAEWLPFYRMLDFPAELLQGRLSFSQAAIGFAAQFAWLAVAVTVLNLTWNRGVRQYSAVGA